YPASGIESLRRCVWARVERNLPCRRWCGRLSGCGRGRGRSGLAGSWRARAGARSREKVRSRCGCGGVTFGGCSRLILIGFNSGAVHFHLDDAGIDAVNRGAKGLIEHVATVGRSPAAAWAHGDLLIQSSQLMNLWTSLAVTDVTSGL